MRRVFGYVACDEASKLKTIGTARFDATLYLEAEEIGLLTATPMINTGYVSG
jgi:hypothetical protein